MDGRYNRFSWRKLMTCKPCLSSGKWNTQVTLLLPHSFCHGILAVPVYIIRPQDKSRGERLEREGEKKISSIMSCKMKWKLEQTRKSSDTKVIISRQLKRNVMIYMGQYMKVLLVMLRTICRCGHVYASAYEENESEKPTLPSLLLCISAFAYLGASLLGGIFRGNDVRDRWIWRRDLTW